MADKKAFLQLLQTSSEVVADQHDGSYQLVRATVEKLGRIPSEVLGIEDLDMLYLMTIGTWKSSYDNKQAKVRASHLSEEDKGSLINLIDELFDKAKQGAFTNCESDQPTIGMYGTGFFTFNRGGTTISHEDIYGFINMCVNILNAHDDDQALEIANQWLNKEIKGLCTIVSQILHCLRPEVFPF